MRSLFKNGEMQGSEKIQAAQCIQTYISGLDFFADAADCHFWAACPGGRKKGRMNRP